MGRPAGMSGERIFLDTAYIQALLNRKDWLHNAAIGAFPRIQAAREAFVTEAIIVEVCNALASINRQAAVRFARGCYDDSRITVIPVDTNLLRRAIEFYERHKDKEWGLTDCISFLVMRDEELTLAATADQHFVQAGFVALLSQQQSG
jgi:predicted nucleic acid-binding protein